ncbi:hypothetical protein CR513_21227, partial [Mucuna pruriens]
MCFRRAERDQVTLEKEQLKEALSALKEREVEREAQFLHLQEKICLLEKEMVKAKSIKEHLVNQRQRSILELAKVQAKAESDETYYQATIKELRKTPFWKDRYIKLAWVANQALVDIPRSLRAAKGMIDPTRTPREIS